MKKYLRRTLWIVIAIIALIFCVRHLSALVRVEYSNNDNESFGQYCEECDIIFLGSSHMMQTVQPMELWQEYGMTSYNLAANGHLIPASYWVMMDALEQADPKLVVMDCYELEKDDKDKRGANHRTIDNMPFGINKVRAVWDLYDTAEKRVEYLWDFSLYHSRWDEVNQDDFRPQVYVGKGAIYNDNIATPNPRIQVERDETYEVHSQGEVYLRKILDECRKRDIDVLLTFIPFPATEKDHLSAQYVEKLAEEYGVNYINFLNTEVVNYETDCSDAHSHLNVSGAGKVTDYLGNYIKENYSIADRRYDELAQRWDQDYNEYLAYKIDRIGSRESLENELMMLTDPNLSYCVYFDDNAGIWARDSVYEALVKNMAGEAELPALQKSIADNSSYFLLMDHGNECIAESAGEGKLTVNASFGQVSYEKGEKGKYGRLYIGESGQEYLAEEENADKTPLAVVMVINNQTGEVASVRKYYDEYRTD